MCQIMLRITDRLEEYFNSDEKHGFFFGNPTFTKSLTREMKKRLSPKGLNLNSSRFGG